MDKPILKIKKGLDIHQMDSYITRKYNIPLKELHPIHRIYNKCRGVHSEVDFSEWVVVLENPTENQYKYLDAIEKEFKRYKNERGLIPVFF